MTEAHAKPGRFDHLRGALRDFPPLAWSFLYFFFLLTGYYVLRPVRDAMGAANDPAAVFPVAMVEWFALRGVDLSTGEVRTVAGTGRQLFLGVRQPQADLRVEAGLQEAAGDLADLLRHQRAAQLARHLVQVAGVRLPLAGLRRRLPLAGHQLAGVREAVRQEGMMRCVVALFFWALAPCAARLTRLRQPKPVPVLRSAPATPVRWARLAAITVCRSCPVWPPAAKS